jgi:predicted O-linked N-acetylglucosamine transferase (SPINDLY family)
MPTVPLQQAFELALRRHRAGQWAEAEALYRQVLDAQPNHADAQNNLGILLAHRGDWKGAETVFRGALQTQPNSAPAWVNFGNVLKEQGRHDEALEAYGAALRLNPNLPDACNSLGNVLKERGKIEEAIEWYRRAIAIRPNYAEVHGNLGSALREQGRLDEAAAACRRALELAPNDALAWNNLGNVLKDRGELKAAIEALQRAVELAPGQAAIRSNLIYTFHFLPEAGEALQVEAQVRWNRQLADPVKGSIQPHANERRADRRLRIGYVSPAFRNHVTGRYLAPLSRNHDHTEFEIFCYSGVGSPDEMTGEFQRWADRWRDVTGVLDEALAEMIRSDEVDILVDLTQHLAGNRLPVFARQPAPVQVSFAGYPASAGVEGIEYRISDRWLEADAERRAGEHVFFIDTFWCYDPCGMEVAVNELPAKRNGHVTFGSLNNFCKINDDVLRLWARVLAAVKDSRLLLLSAPGSHRQRTLDFLASHGAEPAQVQFVAPGRRREYLELYHRVDVALDPFPYGGHTTSLDALWMGVPVVSLAGKTSVSRAGLSILNNLGLPELVTFSEEEYVRIARELAADFPRMAELREILRAKMEASVLMDGPRFARQIEVAYRSMWREWCANQSTRGS